MLNKLIWCAHSTVIYWEKTVNISKHHPALLIPFTTLITWHYLSVTIWLPAMHLSIQRRVRYIASSIRGPVIVVFTTSSRAIIISAPIRFCNIGRELNEQRVYHRGHWNYKYYYCIRYKMWIGESFSFTKDMKLWKH